MSLILGIDPGPVKSAYVLWDTVSETIEDHGIIENDELLSAMRNDRKHAEKVGIEVPRGFGMKAGNEIFDTCIWVGRFDAFRKYPLIGRKEIVTHLCDRSTAGDKDVREALCYRYGGKDKAIGVKKDQGPFYGIKGDEWAALAVCIVMADRIERKEG